MDATERNEELSKWVSLAGRIALGLIFLLSGLMKLPGWSATAGYMASKGMPGVPLLLAAAVVIEIGGGLSLLTGLRTRWGALVLFLYLIPTTLIFHDFWAYGGMERQMQMVNFLKNVSIEGGLLTLWVAGPGALSLDARVGHAPPPPRQIHAT